MGKDKELSEVKLPKRSSSCDKRHSMSAKDSAQGFAAEESKVDRKHRKDRFNGASDKVSV